MRYHRYKYKSGGYYRHRGRSGRYYTTKGCYIATCVYGSYDCPEVWVLRRFRDNNLEQTLIGRIFVRIYYAVSPCLVRAFGNCQWFKRGWKGFLDKMVDYLMRHGVSSAKYSDID